MTRIDADTAARLGADVPRAHHSDPEEMFAGQLRMAGYREAQREFVFHPTRKWRLDFAWPLAKIAVEIEGGIYPMKQKDGTMRPGRHTSPKAFEQDAEKYNAAAVAGWAVLRVTPRMVKDGRALKVLDEALVASAERRGIPRHRPDDD